VGRAPITKRRRTKGTGCMYTRKDGRVVGEYEVNAFAGDREEFVQ
jgi:hypothetical protein